MQAFLLLQANALLAHLVCVCVVGGQGGDQWLNPVVDCLVGRENVLISLFM